MLEIKEIIKKNDEELNENLEECETCGQFAHLFSGLCDWCQKVYDQR